MQLHPRATSSSPRIEGARRWPAHAAPVLRAQPTRRDLTPTSRRLHVLSRRLSPAWQMQNDVDGRARAVGARLLSWSSTARSVATNIGALRRLGDSAAQHGVGEGGAAGGRAAVGRVEGSWGKRAGAGPPVWLGWGHMRARAARGARPGHRPYSDE